MLEAATRSCIQIFPSLGESIIFNPPKREFAWERKPGEFRSQELRNGGTEEIDDLQIRPVAPLSLFISFSRHFAYPTPELLKRLTPEF
jgi:hypothetical protein